MHFCNTGCNCRPRFDSHFSFKQYILSLSLNIRPDDLVGAVLTKDLELTTLVRAGCDCNGQDSHGREPLLVAINKGNIEAMNILIRGGCVLTPEVLLLAIDRGREDAVDALIRAGCDPNNQSEDGRLALVEAIPKMQIVNTIINATNGLPLSIARGNLEAINILIGGGCVLTPEALLLAIDRGNLEAINILIGGECVLTPEALLFAIDKGREDAVDALIRAGCDPNNQSEDDRLALIEAIRKMQIVNTIINATKHLDIH
ncbi:hypothetical protein L7F22_018211 [Adiantum nelumboides]|nr:hypothetical protein [Adiantum nelumboides]